MLVDKSANIINSNQFAIYKNNPNNLDNISKLYSFTLKYGLKGVNI